MDPISIILAAIVVGASAGVGDVVKDEVKKSYAVLKAHILSKFETDSPVVAAVDMVEENPSGQKVKEHLRQALARAQAGQHEEFVALANTLLDTAHTTAENVLRADEDAEVTDPTQSIQADQETSGRLVNEMDVGRRAKVFKPSQEIRIGGEKG